jgi:hypothetical protein
MTGVQGLDSFNRLVAALEPWLDQVVVIGGWAHQLYRLHPHAQALDYPPLTTLDTDVAVPANLPARKQDIRARLLAEGFTEEFLGEDRPPTTHYHLGGESSGFYAGSLPLWLAVDTTASSGARQQWKLLVSSRSSYGTLNSCYISHGRST